MKDMLGNLYGNPHSASPSSQLSSNRIEDIRLKVLQFFKADPEDFDLIFVANATAGIKMVMDVFKGIDGGFNYGYHISAHTSLVGVRESAAVNRCLKDRDVEAWLSGAEEFVQDRKCPLNLFAYPAQSNLDGRRLPMSWAHKARTTANFLSESYYSLLDASALVSTSQLDLNDVSTAPDFTVLSFYKIFGFPDLGALIIRKDSGAILQERKYFGGGTVDLVVCSPKEQWHVLKSSSLHDSLEDGTLPVHSILALDAAIDTHKTLYGSMNNIARHTAYLSQRLYSGLASLKHGNSQDVCAMHSHPPSLDRSQGPIVAFNLKNSRGAWVSNFEFEKLASVRKFHIRTGSLCNPGGIAESLHLEAWELRRNFSAGFRCGTENNIYSGKITGVIRVSLGAMSTMSDVESFLSFVQEFYVEETYNSLHEVEVTSKKDPDLIVESLTIYPIKSCGGYSVPANTQWEVRPEGLVWDREWCLLHKGTGQALSQKRHPRMALIQPTVDFDAGVLRVRYVGTCAAGGEQEIHIPLSADPSVFTSSNPKLLSSRICGDAVIAQIYGMSDFNEFFSNILDVPCALARFPAGGSGLSTRHAKAHMQNHQRPAIGGLRSVISHRSLPIPPTPPDSDGETHKRPILLSNESPILAINRSSLDALNAEITKTGGKPAEASVFRANIILAPASSNTSQTPYSEDHWSKIRIGQQEFQMLGSCRRCHMICINQDTAEKDSEPFVTLAKTRRFESKVFFGSHMCHVGSSDGRKESQWPTIAVGDAVVIEQ